ncbi:MAG: DUF126 domain-containing protein [Pseudomonadota bacterium]
MKNSIQAEQVLNGGRARGPVLKLEEALSFWGAFDPGSGRILDRLHPQAGLCIAGQVLVMPQSRGSAGTPAALAEALRHKKGPAALVLRKADVNLTMGAMVADRLYGLETPVVVVSETDYEGLATGPMADITAGGQIILAPIDP